MARDRWAGLRMTEWEFDNLTEIAKFGGMAKSDVIREGINAFLHLSWYPYPAYKPRCQGIYIVTLTLGDENERYVETNAIYAKAGDNDPCFMIFRGDEWRAANNVVAFMEFPLAYREGLTNRKGEEE